MNITLIVLAALALVLVGAFGSGIIKRFFELIYMFTIWPWTVVFKDGGYSTGNGAGAMAVLFSMVIIGVQLVVVVVAAIIYGGWKLFS